MTIDKAPQPFPRTEYLRRIAAVKAEMARRDIDALVVNFDRNIAWLTGYTALSAYVPQGLVVSMSEEEPTLILRKMDVVAGHYLTFLAPEKVIGYPEAFVGAPDKDGYDAIINFLDEIGVGSRGVGLEYDDLPRRALEKFRARLPNARISDFSTAIAWIRMEKSDLEISIMKEAAAITNAAMVRAFEVIRPGVREADAAAEIIGTLVRGINGKAGTKLANFFLNTSPRTGTSHIRWSEDVFRPGSHINTEFAGVRYAYTVPMARTLSVGEPSDHLKRIHDAQTAGFDAAMDVIRAGRTCSDVAQAIHRTLGKLGVKKESRCGYPVGIDWGENTASFYEGDMTVLKPNMTFHLHLGNWVDDDFGVMVSDTIRITERGAELLTDAPRKVIELPA
ncbi:M24 family metallopeptidase [Bradyrhizobium sp. JR3.5]